MGVNMLFCFYNELFPRVAVADLLLGDLVCRCHVETNYEIYHWKMLKVSANS